MDEGLHSGKIIPFMQPSANTPTTTVIPSLPSHKRPLSSPERRC